MDSQARFSHRKCVQGTHGLQCCKAASCQAAPVVSPIPSRKTQVTSVEAVIRKGPPNPPRGAHQSSWKWGYNPRSTMADISRSTLQSIYQHICSTLESEQWVPKTSLLFSLLQSLNQACKRISPLESRELASAFVAMLAWELGTQTTQTENWTFDTTFVHLAKVTVALAYHDNTMATAKPQQVRNSLEVQWLTLAFTWTFTHKETLAATNLTLPTSRLHTREHLLTTNLNNMDANDRPVVEAILNINFNRHSSGQLIKQTRPWYQSHLTAPCSVPAL